MLISSQSDHPAIVSRYLLHEAQQAHYYGLPENLAMKSVISTPAEVLGLDHRIGFLREGIHVVPLPFVGLTIYNLSEGYDAGKQIFPTQQKDISLTEG